MNEPTVWTAALIRGLKGKRKIACLTAYDYAMARLLDEAAIPLCLVGDSLAMPVLGYETTLPVTVDDMVHHTAAVSRGARNSLVVADMPFMSYQASSEEGLRNAGRLLKEGGAGAVKIEGGARRADFVRSLVDSGIPVMGHIGLTPQSIHTLGGFRVQGRRRADAQGLLADARALDEAGVFALVLECLPRALAGEITAAVGVPTIGIGAGPHCDGQVLVLHDLLGLYGDFKPRFVKRYAEMGEAVHNALVQYRAEVESGDFPDDEHSYS